MPASPDSTFIITADDLGYTNAINRGILAARGHLARELDGEHAIHR